MLINFYCSRPKNRRQDYYHKRVCLIQAQRGVKVCYLTMIATEMIRPIVRRRQTNEGEFIIVVIKLTREKKKL